MDVLSFDTNLFFLINHGTANVLFDIVMPALTSKGFLLLIPYVCYLIWKAYEDMKGGSKVLLHKVLGAMAISLFSFLLADWLANEIKHAIGRVRPCNALDGVRLLVGCTKSGSMPSNHAVNSFACAVPLFYYTKGCAGSLWRVFPVGLAILVTFSRVYTGVHYPTDVVAGAMIGSLIAVTLIVGYSYVSRSFNSRPHTTVLAVTLFVISVFRIYYILHGPLDLSPDEAHYWEWSRRLDLSYYSKGPMIAYLIRLGTSVFGDTVLGIRVFAVVFSALTSISLFRLADLIFKEKTTALYSALLFQAIPLFAPFGVVFTIDSPFLFFWTISLLLFYKAMGNPPSPPFAEEGKAESSDSSQNAGAEPKASEFSSWFLLGITMGLGLLTKYTMAFFYACALLFLIASPKRVVLRTAGPYVAAGVSLIVFSPVIIWNMQQDWVTVRHTAGQAHLMEGFGLSVTYLLDFLGSQVGAVTPVIFFMMAYALLRRGVNDSRIENLFLFWFSVPVVAFFLFKSIQGKVQANWAMTGYITGLIAVTRFALDGTEGASHALRTRKKLFWAGACLALLVTSVAHFPGILKLPPNLDPSARLRGWKGLGTEVSRIYDSLREQGEVLIFSDAYQVSSEMAFYVRGHPTTFCVNLGRRMNQYDLWPDMNSAAAAIRQGKSRQPVMINAIFVRTGDRDMPPEIGNAFESFEKRLVKASGSGHVLRTYSVFVCYNFKELKTRDPESY